MAEQATRNPSPQPPPRNGEGERRRLLWLAPPLRCGEGVGGRGILSAPEQATRNRAAFTVAECVIALAVIGVVAVVVGQCFVWSVGERARLRARQAALELAANVLEAGRAASWDKLDRQWAEEQTIPAEMATLLPAGKLVVTLEAEKSLPHTRRLTVEVRWQFDPQVPPQSVELTTLLSARTAAKPGGKS